MTRREGSGERGGSGWLRRWVGVFALWAVIVAAVLWVRWPRAPEAEETAVARRLARWSLLGCWDLVPEPWTTSTAARPAAVDDATGLPPMPDGSSVDAPALPATVMLASDSLDEWGRVLDSYRAVVRDPAGSADARWFVRHDTLWLLPTEPGYRFGVALFDEGNRFRDRARLIGDSLDATAPVTAYRVNCATGVRGLPRRYRR